MSHSTYENEAESTGLEPATPAVTGRGSTLYPSHRFFTKPKRPIRHLIRFLHRKGFRVTQDHTIKVWRIEGKGRDDWQTYTGDYDELSELVTLARRLRVKR